MATFAFVASASPSTPKSLALDDVPKAVRDQCEEVYAALKANPNGRIRGEFESKQELLQFATLAAVYCEHRPAGKLRFRKSPTRGLPDNVMEFRIADPLTKSDEITEEIREKTAVANGKTTRKAAK